MRLPANTLEEIVANKRDIKILIILSVFLLVVIVFPLRLLAEATLRQTVTSSTPWSGVLAGASISGNTVVVGEASNLGRLHVYTFDGVNVVHKTVIPGDGEAFYLGAGRFAISGNLIVAGMPDANPNGLYEGQVRIYTFDGSTATLVAKLNGTQYQEEFGEAVAVDGNTIVIGARLANYGGGSRSGRVYIYTFDGTNVTLKDTIDGEVFHGELGASVDVSGNTIVASVPWASPNGISASGQVRIYYFDGSTATLVETIDGDDVGDGLGQMVRIDGNIIAASTDFADPGGIPHAGQARVYTFDGTTATLRSIVNGGVSAGAPDLLGTSLVVSGNSVGISIPGWDTSLGNDVGQIRIYNFDGTTLVLDTTIDGTFSGEKFGTLDFEDNKLVTGSVNFDAGVIGSVGKVDFYSLGPVNSEPVITVDLAAIVVDEGGTGANTGTVTDQDGDTVTLTASLGDAINNNDGTWSWSYDTVDNLAAQPVTISADDGNGGTAEVTFDLTVSNVAPAVDAGDDVTILTSDMIDVNAPFSDPGALDTHTATIDFGLGAGPQSAVIDDGVVIGTQQYTNPGLYTVTVCVTDDDGGTGCDGLNVDVVVSQVAAHVVLGQEGVWIRQNSTVASGNVGANVASPGPYLSDEAELTVGIGATFLDPASRALADTINVKDNGSIYDVYYNEISGLGDILGDQYTPLALPLVDSFPPVPVFAPGLQTIDVPKNGSQILTADDYDVLKVRNGATVTFEGGIYNFAEWDVGDNVSLYFEAPTEIRVADKLAVGKGSYLGAAPGSNGIDASDIVIYVAGQNGSNGNLGASPKAAKLGINTLIAANIYAPNGTLWLRDSSNATGAFLGKWVIVGIGARVTLDSAFTEDGNTLGLTSAPETTEPLSPLDGASVISPVTVAWEGDPALCYQVQVDDSADFSSPNENVTVVHELEYTTTTLADGQYYWRVAKSGNCSTATGPWSEVWSFIAQNS